MSERCDRCGNEGSDRRTLWMACFYAMNELPVPFKQVRLANAVYCEKTGEKTFDHFNITVPVFAEPTGMAQDKNFFTLRVCKRCRGEWMAAIENWFKANPQGEDHDADERTESTVGSGIFVRQNGAIQEISEEEWRRLHGNREPVRVQRRSESGSDL